MSTQTEHKNKDLAFGNTIFFTILIFIISLIFIGFNPSIEDHQIAFKNRFIAYENLMLHENSYNLTAQNIEQTNAILELDTTIGRIIKRENYLLFSLTKYQYNKNSTVIGVGIFGKIYYNHGIDDKLKDLKNILTTTMNTRIYSSDNNAQVVLNNYSGTYYDEDQSTGWQTTVIITDGSFVAQTIAPSGETIASGSGKLNQNTLINEYGQNIGYVTNSHLSIRFGSATIECKKR